MCKNLFILCLVSLLAMPILAQTKGADKPFTLVIDAGHGGKDPGAVGRHSYEKDLNLDVSLLAGRLIQEAYPEVRVLYTRSTDVFITLQGRADFVNKNNADLFICVHTNSTDQASACGAETFVLGTDKMEKNLDVAMRENAVIKLESDYKTTYQGFDPNSIDSYIMFELMQNSYMDQSLRFATLVQQQFVDSLHRVDRGVKQGALWVLLKSACPSILLEMGFISNPSEERYLNSQEGQMEMASSILRAFQQFYRKPAAVVPAASDETAAPAKPADKPADKPAAKPAQKPADKPAAKPAQKPAAKPETKPAPQPEAKPAPKTDTIPAPAKDTLPVAKTDTAPHVAQDTIPAAPKEPVYAVQIMALREKLPANSSAFKGLPCNYFERDGWYKYYTGASSDQAQVRRTLTEVRALFPGCFIVKL